MAFLGVALSLVLPVRGADNPSVPPGAHTTGDCIKVTSKASLVHLGSLDSFDITTGGTTAAIQILECVEKGNLEGARGASAIYQRIIPNENFGGEYTALNWLCEYLVAPPREQKALLQDRYVASFYHVLADNNYDLLRTYLRRKYHIGQGKTREDDEAAHRFRFLEDFILFNNPRREQWEKSSRIIEAIGLKPGAVVADVGCGPGYYTFKFAEIVGGAGQVYAIDNNERHLRYLSGLTKEFGIRNVHVVKPLAGDVNLPGDVQLDHAFLCSMYHVLYAAASEGEREGFIASIRRRLKPGGTLVLVDNSLVEDQTLPYHGPHIAKELVINQLEHYGFTLVATHQFIPQRYMLIFKLSGEGAAATGRGTLCDGKDCIPLRSSLSLVHFDKGGTGPGFSLAGRKAARHFYLALDRGDKTEARTAAALFKELLPRERFGDEYSAFLWYCDYLLASPEQRKRLLSDRFDAEYFRFLGGESFTILKKYVYYKYYLDAADADVEKGPGANIRPKEPDITQDQMIDWGEFIAFNNPRRETWERTSELLKFLNLRPGTSVADVGCGPGYYTYKFSELVGNRGRVFAVDTNDEILNFVNSIASRHGLTNVTPIKSRLNDTQLPSDSVDMVFLCSLYHSVYITSMEYVKDQFIESIKRALKKGGRLVIADNDVLRDDQVPYYGPRIDRRLTIAQLKHYGFRLVDTAQFIPQRYVLVFQVDERPSSP
jgi:predicted methyltransferase